MQNKPLHNPLITFFFLDRTMTFCPFKEQVDELLLLLLAYMPVCLTAQYTVPHRQLELVDVSRKENWYTMLLPVAVVLIGL
jgi:hypothetical protein